MDQIASIERLQQCLNAIRISDDYHYLQNLITELHFAYEVFRFKGELPVLSDQRTLWDATYYLLTALTNPRRQFKIAQDHLDDGLAISGLIFELLGRYASIQNDIELERHCLLNAAIADTLSRYEANSAVLAKRHFRSDLLPDGREEYLARCAEYGLNLVLALLAREFFWIHQSGARLLEFLDSPEEMLDGLNDMGSKYTEELAFWTAMCWTVVQFTGFMIGGEEESYRIALHHLDGARQQACDDELLWEHWLASRILDCVRRMYSHSTWHVLRDQGFSETYISTLTRFPWNAVHELWHSQIAALAKVDTPDHPEESNILSDNVKRVVVSMPTSAGKTLLAEMTVVRVLEHGHGKKCVYVAPSRALVDEVETKLHQRLRLLGYRVASVVGAFEIDFLEQDYLAKVDVVVLTPEKLDYLFRKRDPFVADIGLIVFDEAHKVSDGSRGWLFETLVTWLLLRADLKEVKMVFMSAVLPHSQQPLVRMWIGQRSLAPILASDWSPTRQLIGVLWYSQLKRDWNRPIEIDKKGNRCYWGMSANLAFNYGIGTESRVLRDLYRSSFWINDNYKEVRDRDKENRFDRCLWLIKQLGLANSTLVYFQEKVNLTWFCGHACKQLDSVDSEGLARLAQYISARLGPDSPMLSSLPYGVAYHHGDLPVDVRNEIESAYRDRVLRILACTTTLAEGVNLPIQTLILGYHQTYSGNRLSVRDFKNIVGRAGRALVETEGEIIAICHPEFSRDKTDRDKENARYFRSLVDFDEEHLAVKSAFPLDKYERDEIIGELNALAEAIRDAQRLAEIEYIEEIADEIQRLQVLIFTLYEDGILDETSESVENALQSTLLFLGSSDADIRRAIFQLGERFWAVCRQMDAVRLRVYNTSGLRYKSNHLLEQLAQQIAERCSGLTSEQYSFETVITPETLQFILDNIREAQPRRSEYRQNQYKVVSTLDHYRILIDWLQGADFSVIRNSHFSELNNIALRTETCQSYISKQFTFKLPWVLAAMHTHVESHRNPLLSFWLEAAPAQVKYGVDTPEAVYFSSIGVRSRFLARALGQLYREERGAMTEANWEPLGDWFQTLSPFSLHEKLPDLPDLAIRQAVRRANTIRRPSNELRKTGRVAFTIAGWQYYNGQRLIDDIIEQVWGIEKPLVQLQHEPSNEYDEYAVSIHWGYPSVESKLGYVPRDRNEEIAVLLALGAQLEARIITVGSLNSSGWRPVNVRVALVADRE